MEIGIVIYNRIEQNARVHFWICDRSNVVRGTCVTEHTSSSPRRTVRNDLENWGLLAFSQSVSPFKPFDKP